MTQKSVVTLDMGNGPKPYALVVMKTVDYDQHGRASQVIVGYDDSEFNIQGGEQFWTALVPVEMTAREKPQ